MVSSNLRLRTGALAAAAGLLLAGVVAASPAAAEEVVAPVIEVDKTTFPAGDWEGGFTVTGSGFDPSVPTAELSIGAMGENGGGGIYSEDLAVSADGTIDAVVVPDAATVVPDAAGWPKYFVVVAQEQAPGQPWLNSNRVDLTITEGASLTVAAEATAEQLVAGLNAQFSGFAPGESVSFLVTLSRWNQEEEITELIDEVEGVVTADAEGNGSISGALEGAAIDDSVRIDVVGEESSRVAAGFSRVVATPAPAPGPAPAPAGTAGGAQLAETGVELGAGIAALALLVLGAGVLIVTRRVRATQR